jgi:hypothetical protein
VSAPAETAEQVRSPASHEDPGERLNRNLDQLLQELRVALPGVQVLFAFLLTVPFQARYGKTTEAQRAVYGIAVALAALASACLIAPSIQHRLLFHQKQKPRLLRMANRLAITGMLLLGAAIVTAFALVLSFVFSTAAAIVASAALAVVIATIWVAIPLFWRVERD